MLIPPARLRDLVIEILTGVGADRPEAAQVAEVLTWADRRGRHPQGAVWLDALTARLVDGNLLSPAPLTVDRRRPARAAIDCGAGFGHVAGHRACELVIEAARTNGVAVVTVSNSTHFGPCGYYAELLADAGLLGLAATNAYPKVAVHGSAGAVLGTNPVGFAAPSAVGQPIIGDLSTGSIAGSRVRDATARGEDLESGVALDRNGLPTVDPTALDDGGVMLPFGGAKGSALGLLVELLTSVLGAGTTPPELGSMFRSGPVGTSHVVMAIAADDELGQRADGLRRLVESAPARPGFDVRLPGDAGRRRQRDNPTVELPDDSVRALKIGAERAGLAPADLGIS